MDQAIIEQAKAYIAALFRDNADGHDASHTLRVYRNALQIAAAYPACDLFVVSLAALLHDADDHKLFRTENNENARRFLQAQVVDVAAADRICGAIQTVSFSQNKDKRPATLEAQIVQDADRLDAVGAVGIARAFAYGGKNGRSLAATVGHFHEKLLKLKGLMNTPEAIALAEARHAFMEAFLAELQKETGGVLQEH